MIDADRLVTIVEPPERSMTCGPILGENRAKAISWRRRSAWRETGSRQFYNGGGEVDDMAGSVADFTACLDPFWP